MPATGSTARSKPPAAPKTWTRCPPRRQRPRSEAFPTPSPPRTGNKGKKAACLDIINVMMRIYFRLNTLRLCKNLTNTVDKGQILPLQAYPLAHRVTYAYFVGRLSIFDEQYSRVREQEAVSVEGKIHQ